MPTVHRELEVKYDADEDVQVPSLMEMVGALRGRPGAPRADGTPLAEGESAAVHLGATYFDTAELDLAAAGLTLRRRSGGEDEGWHLKVPVPDGSRSEVRVPLDEGEQSVPGRLAGMVVART